jgi:hypothetical protein
MPLITDWVAMVPVNISINDVLPGHQSIDELVTLDLEALFMCVAART